MQNSEEKLVDASQGNGDLKNLIVPLNIDNLNTSASSQFFSDRSGTKTTLSQWKKTLYQELMDDDAMTPNGTHRKSHQELTFENKMKYITDKPEELIRHKYHS